MKKLVLIVVVALAGLVGYNFVRTGELALVPRSATPEERQVADLEQRFDDARTQFSQAGRTAALSGIDTTADADAALRDVHDLEKSLAKLKSALEPGSAAARKAERLASAIAEFERQVR